MFKKRRGRRNFLERVGAGVCADWIKSGLAVADENLSRARGEHKKGTQDVKVPRYVRYVEDAADMARIIRGEKPTDFPYEHDLMVQETLLQARALPLKD